MKRFFRMGNWRTISMIVLFMFFFGLEATVGSKFDKLRREIDKLQEDTYFNALLVYVTPSDVDIKKGKEYLTEAHEELRRNNYYAE